MCLVIIRLTILAYKRPGGLVMSKRRRRHSSMAASIHKQNRCSFGRLRLFIYTSHIHFIIICVMGINLHKHLPLMGGRPGHNRRRSTRNKTIVFDANTLLQDEEPQQTTFADNIAVIMNPHVSVSQIDSRSHCFKDLLNAFHSIEKRVDKDPTFVSEALKKFKTNDDLAVNTDQTSIQEMIKLDLFPKIRNNPFLRNEGEIPFRKIEKNFNCNQLRNNKYN